METKIIGRWSDLKLIKEALRVGLSHINDPFCCAPGCRIPEEELPSCEKCIEEFVENILWEEC